MILNTHIANTLAPQANKAMVAILACELSRTKRFVCRHRRSFMHRAWFPAYPLRKQVIKFTKTNNQIF